MNRRTLLLLFVVFTLIVIVFVATFIGPNLFIAGGPNLICNGSFEAGKFVDDPAEPIVRGPECKMLCGGSSALDNWQIFRQPVTGDQNCDSAKDAICWSQSPNTLNINAQDGQRDVDLSGFFGRPPKQFGQVQQSVENTQPGVSYELSFAIGSSAKFPPPTPAPPSPPRIGVFVKVIGVPDADRSFDATTPTAEVSHWDPHSYRFRAADRTTTIIFMGTGEPGTSGNGGDYVGLDNVSLREVCWIVSAILFGCSVQSHCG
jgi:hypothetical protein